jgi:hypothetical protein
MNEKLKVYSECMNNIGIDTKKYQECPEERTSTSELELD